MPQAKADTVWLECTSQTIPFGRLGAFTEDRLALVVTPTGGRLQRTPASTHHENSTSRTTKLSVKTSGDAEGLITLSYSGDRAIGVISRLAAVSSLERDEWLRTEMALPTFRLGDGDFSSLRPQSPSQEVAAEVVIPRFVSTTGSRLFSPVIPHETRPPALPSMDQERTQPIHLASVPVSWTDTVTVSIPSGYSVESLPHPVQVEESFASYRLAVDATNEQLRTVRYLAVKEAIIPPEAYEQVRTLFSTVRKADRSQVVLVRKDDP